MKSETNKSMGRKAGRIEAALKRQADVLEYLHFSKHEDCKLIR
jgi:hypothetical protein